MVKKFIGNLVTGLVMAAVMVVGAETIFAACSATPQGVGCQDVSCSCSNDGSCNSFAASTSEANENCGGQAGCSYQCQGGEKAYKCCTGEID